MDAMGKDTMGKGASAFTVKSLKMVRRNHERHAQRVGPQNDFVRTFERQR
jgi:hypothetical protein